MTKNNDDYLANFVTIDMDDLAKSGLRAKSYIECKVHSLRLANAKEPTDLAATPYIDFINVKSHYQIPAGLTAEEKITYLEEANWQAEVRYDYSNSSEMFLNADDYMDFLKKYYSDLSKRESNIMRETIRNFLPSVKDYTLTEQVCFIDKLSKSIYEAMLLLNSDY